jgi:hypothetical protein
MLLFLGAFAKLRKVTISFVMFVRPSVRIEQGSNWMDFHEISYLKIICQENSGIIEIWQRVLQTQTYVGFIVINVCNHGEHYETPCISLGSPYNENYFRQKL